MSKERKRLTKKLFESILNNQNMDKFGTRLRKSSPTDFELELNNYRRKFFNHYY